MKKRGLGLGAWGLGRPAWAAAMLALAGSSLIAAPLALAQQDEASQKALEEQIAMLRGDLKVRRDSAVDALITLASVVSGTDYRKDGLTVEKMGLAGVTAKDLPKVLRDGF